MAERRVGIWLLGARGGVATTAAIGLVALRQRLISQVGLVSAAPQFEKLELLTWEQCVLGGHEIRKSRLYDEGLKLSRVSRAIDEKLVDQCRAGLDDIDRNIRPGVLFNVGPTIESLADAHDRDKRETPRAAITRVQDDLREFQQRQSLDQVIVMNVASTEPPLDLTELPQRWEDLAPQLESPDCPLPASSLYAIATLELGFPYLNFTPSAGSAPQAIQQLALERQTCHMGHDGKTGETLLKSTLAPMFAARNLEVMSWVGHNIFGNLDGKVLDDPVNKRSKVTSKDRLLAEIFGYTPQTHVSIEYIQSLGDWKTAWDHIHFRGFLGTPMILQFTWQGCDSLLAAPLVLDLIRFAELADRRGEIGLLTFLASFFKSPLGVSEHSFIQQFQLLQDWAAQHSP